MAWQLQWLEAEADFGTLRDAISNDIEARRDRLTQAMSAPLLGWQWGMPVGYVIAGYNDMTPFAAPGRGTEMLIGLMAFVPRDTCIMPGHAVWMSATPRSRLTPGLGDESWSVGCRTYAFGKQRLKRVVASRQQSWFRVMDDSHHLVFVLDQLPVRFYRGLAEEPTVRTLRRQVAEAQQLGLALRLDEAEGLVFGSQSKPA